MNYYCLIEKQLHIVTKYMFFVITQKKVKSFFLIVLCNSFQDHLQSTDNKTNG